MYRSLLFFIIVFFSLNGVLAQYTGFPIRNYTAAEYNASPQCWSAIQDKNGILYFGSSTFLLEYDGQTFRKIFVQKSAAVRSLAIDSKGRIYVASVGNFGYLEDDEVGGKEFVSLLPLVAEQDRSFSDIWKIHIIHDTVYFQSNERIFIYDQKNITAVEHKFPFASISFKADDKFIVRVKNRGLHELRNGRLVMMPGTERFSDEPVFGVVPDRLDPKKYLVLSGTKGFYRLKKDCRDKQGDCLEKVSSSNDSLIMNAGVLGMGWLNDSVLAIHSRTGLYLLNKELGIQDVINKSSGLADEAVSSYFTDRNGQTWLALNNGLAKVSLSSPFYYYTEKTGLNGVLESAIRDGDYLYIGTTSGVFYSKLHDTLFTRTYLNNRLTFHPIENLKIEGWNFLRHDGKIYVATSLGTFMLDKGKAVQLTENYTTTISRSYVSDRLYFGQKDGLAIYKTQPEGKPERLLFFPFSEDILHVSEIPPSGEKAGELWLSTRFKGLIKFKLGDHIDPSFQYYDTLNGVPQGNVNPVLKDGKIFFFNSNNGFVYNELRDKGNRSDKCFETVPLLSNVGISDPRYWEFKFSRHFTRSQLKELEIFDKSISNIINDKNDISWLCVGDKLVRFDGRYTSTNVRSFKTLIRSIISRDSVISMGAIQGNDSSQTTFPYSLNNLSFTFAADWFDHEEATLFRWRLVGFDTTWSVWGKGHAKEYTNLPEGEYRLEAQSQNLYGEQGQTASFVFNVLPPWYRSLPAFLLYALGFAGVLYLTMKLSVSRLEKAKVKLESLITERTAEVVKQKDLIEQKSSLLELAYKDISDSISYASRIQQAILPAESEMRECFKDHFILFHPRDIVSGDFYWHAVNGDNVFIAVADCTGHGVPGAFMSMIGNTLLNEIIITKKITDPGEILSQLDRGVKRALKQLTGETESNDGMDIALCRYNRSTNELWYAGANRPLFTFTGGELVEFKADKKPVGGAFHPEGSYTSNTVKLNKDTMIYMFSDGYHDQFGGPSGKKFMMKRLKALLSDIHHKTCNEQRIVLAESLENWKGQIEQIDDVLVVGVRF